MLLFVLSACGVQDEPEPEITVATSAVEGGLAHDFECAMCTGRNPCNTSCAEANGDPSTCGLAGPTCTSARADVARLFGTASASSTYNSLTPASSTIDDDRRGINWANGGGWSDGTAYAYPDLLQVALWTSRVVTHVDVYTLQDACGASPSTTNCKEPTSTMTFANFGITDFRVEYWDGSAYRTAATIRDNNLVKRSIPLSPPVFTNRVRVVVNGAKGGYSRIIEVDAWEDRYANDPSLVASLDARITMSGITGCESTTRSTTINGIGGVYRRCDYAWVVASPGNGAWLLPQSHISNAYLGGTTWPSTPTTTMNKMGFPKGAYHGSDAGDSYVVFERGILAKSNTHATVRRIGGLDQASAGGSQWMTANTALVNAWLTAPFTDKYPVTDTRPWVCTGSFCTYGTQYSDHGFRFTTENNAAGYNSTFLVQYGADAAFHLDGAIENEWQAAAATPGTLATLGWPITNELALASGSRISQFTGGAILYQAVTGCTGAREAKIVTGPSQPTPLFRQRVTGLSCTTDTILACQNGPLKQFVAPDGTMGAYQFQCNTSYGWWDTVAFKWFDPQGDLVELKVSTPILARYLNTDPIGGSGAPISVEAAIRDGMGLPEGNAFNTLDHTRQVFQNGTITDHAACSDVCTTTTPCSLTCTEAGARQTCGDHRPESFVHGKCQLFDIYCELPEVIDAHVLDNKEGSLNGPEAFFYYQKRGEAEKRGRMPAQLGVPGVTEISNYFAIWNKPDLSQGRFPYASNFAGPREVSPAPMYKLQLEFSDHSTNALRHPVLPAQHCELVPQTIYGVHPSPPSFPPVSLQHVLEDDECHAGFCNGDDYVASIRFYYNECAAQVWGTSAFGFTARRELTNQTPTGGLGPDLGGEGYGGSDVIDRLGYRTYCYRGYNLQSASAELINKPEFGIGTAQFPGYIAP